MNPTTTCSHCGEPWTETHDSTRCWTIAHALAAHHTPGRTPTEADRHIVELRAWLAAHEPGPHWTAGQRQAYDDRVRSLTMWLNKAQLVNRV